MIAIRELLPRDALAWQEELGVVGILDSYYPELALGAFAEGALVGVATFSPAGGRLVGLFVRPEARRQGVARRLMIEALDRIGQPVVVADVNFASGMLIASLPEAYRSRIDERDWD